MTTAADISPEAVERMAQFLPIAHMQEELDKAAAMLRALRSALTDAQEIARRGDDIILGLEKTLDVARSSLTARDWQPIATAPHMRKIIVHYLNQLGKHRTVMACYYEKNSLEMHDDYAEVGTYDAEKDGYFADEGWYEEHDSEDPIMKLQGEPDHWMPLPEPPK